VTDSLNAKGDRFTGHRQHIVVSGDKEWNDGARTEPAPATHLPPRGAAAGELARLVESVDLAERNAPWGGVAVQTGPLQTSE
jgi:hypothetical protein